MKRIKVGDIFEIDTPKGKGYFLYVFKDPHFGHLIKVIPKEYYQTPKDIKNIFSTEKSYFTFFPLSAALNKNIVRYVDTITDTSILDKPKLMRDPIEVDEEGKVYSWRITNMETEEYEIIKQQLSEEQKKLSLRGICNDTMLIERMQEGWMPEKWS